MLYEKGGRRDFGTIGSQDKAATLIQAQNDRRSYGDKNFTTRRTWRKIDYARSAVTAGIWRSHQMAKKRNALGLDIGSSSVKLVQLRETKKGIDLVNFSEHPLPSQAIVDGALMNATAVIEAIREMVASLKLKSKWRSH